MRSISGISNKATWFSGRASDNFKNPSSNLVEKIALLNLGFIGQFHQGIYMVKKVNSSILRQTKAIKQPTEIQMDKQSRKTAKSD